MCTLCRETLDDPCTLNCLHSLCKACFERKLEEEKNDSCTDLSTISINCPACFYSTSFQTFDNFKTDLEKQIKVPQVLRTLFDLESKIDFSLCVSCKNQGTNTKASFWCFDCVNTFCKECLNFHLSIPLLEKHKTYSFDEVNNNKSIIPKARELCDEHNVCLHYV